MRGLMQDWPLLCHKLIDHAAAFHGGRQIVSRSLEGPIHRSSYREVRRRAAFRVPKSRGPMWLMSAGDYKEIFG